MRRENQTFNFNSHWNCSISVKPFLKQPGMYDIEVRKGRTFRYDLWFGGEPPPTVFWERR